MIVEDCSVIIPNYNHGAYLTERIETLIINEKNISEFIILDDASDDTSVAIINNYLPRLKNHKFIVNRINSSSTFHQWNYGVTLAKNNLINIAESDDSAEIGLITTLKNRIELNRDVVLSFCASNIIDYQSKKIGIWRYEYPIFESDFVMNGPEFIEKYLIHSNVIPNASAVLFKKAYFTQIGLANASLKTNSDWLVWLKLLCHGKVAYSAKPLNNFRQHSNSVTANSIDISSNSFKEIYSLTLRLEFRKYLNDLGDKRFKNIYLINENYISYDLGYKSLYLLKNRKILNSLFVLSQSFFTGSLKTYFLKKYIVDIGNYLFKKQ